MTTTRQTKKVSQFMKTTKLRLNKKHKQYQIYTLMQHLMVEQTTRLNCNSPIRNWWWSMNCPKKLTQSKFHTAISINEARSALKPLNQSLWLLSSEGYLCWPQVTSVSTKELLSSKILKLIISPHRISHPWPIKVS